MRYLVVTLASLLIGCLEFSPYEGTGRTGGSCDVPSSPGPLTADGDGSDWQTGPVQTDSSSDATGPKSGDDIENMYAATWNGLLFIRINLSEPANQDFMDAPAPNDGRYGFLVDDSDTESSYSFDVYHSGVWSFRLNPGVSGDPTVGVLGSTIEVHMNLEWLPSPDVFSIRASTGTCVPNCDTQWDVVSCP